MAVDQSFSPDLSPAVTTLGTLQLHCPSWCVTDHPSAETLGAHLDQFRVTWGVDGPAVFVDHAADQVGPFLRQGVTNAVTGELDAYVTVDPEWSGFKSDDQLGDSDVGGAGLRVLAEQATACAEWVEAQRSA